jgi:hypothetical protein
MGFVRTSDELQPTRSVPIRVRAPAMHVALSNQAVPAKSRKTTFGAAPEPKGYRPSLLVFKLPKGRGHYELWAKPKAHVGGKLRISCLERDDDYYYSILCNLIRYQGGGPLPFTPANGYITENGAYFYVAEDGTAFYVQET